MPFIQKLLLSIPPFQIACVVIGLSVTLASIVTLCTRYIIPYHKRQKYSISMAILFGSNALIYAILLTWVLFSAWSDFQNAQANVERESNSLVELYRDTDAFLPEIKQDANVLLKEYTKSIINQEWDTLSRSELSPYTTEVRKKIWNLYSSFSPKTETEQVFLHEAVRKLYELREYRTQRLSDSKRAVYPVLWFLLLLGEVATIYSMAIFAEDLRSSLSVMCFFGFLVGLILYSIIMFDFPYTGEPHVSSEPLKQALLYW